jgi:hypothetical protein
MMKSRKRAMSTSRLPKRRNKKWTQLDFFVGHVEPEAVMARDQRDRTRPKPYIFLLQVILVLHVYTATSKSKFLSFHFY